MNLKPEREAAERHKRRAVFLVLMVIALLGLAMAWRWTALGDYLDTESIIAAFRSARLAESPGTAIAVIVLASIVAVPLGVIIGFAALLFGPLYGPFYVLLGAGVGAGISFAIGKYLGHDALRLFAGPRLMLLSQYFGRRGFLSVLVLRLVPVAPFAIVNMMAGTSHIRWQNFMAATMIGMLPGIFAITFFIDTIIEAIRFPGWQTWAICAGVLLLMVAASAGFRLWGRRLETKAAREGLPPEAL